MKPTLLHPHARRRLDTEVWRGFQALRRKPVSRAYYNRILIAVRQHSTLLQPTAKGAWESDIVRALVRLSTQHRRYVRPPESWPGGDGSVYELVASLAQHLLTRYRVPPILACVWLRPPTPMFRTMMRWFLEHGQGRPIRTLIGVSMSLTRAMEHHFLRSPPHLSFPAAFRRAEILGLGGSPSLADAVCRTVLGRRLNDRLFWRSVLTFLVDHRDALTECRTVAIIEAIDALGPTLRALDGGQLRAKRLLRGRNPESLERALLQIRPPPPPVVACSGGVQWSPTGVEGWTWFEASGPNAVAWHIVELLGAAALQEEGRAMRHCVGTYVGRCVRGTSRIWSLRVQRGNEAPASRVTIEVSPRQRWIVQVRGRLNRRPPDAQLQIIRAWAAERGLTVAASSWV